MRNLQSRFNTGFTRFSLLSGISRFFGIPGILLFLMGFILAACQPQPRDIHPSQAYAPYIAAYTGGLISPQSPIRIELTQDQPMVHLHEELTDNPFRFTPSLKGKCYWMDNHTLAFLPDPGSLQPGTLYEGSFDLARFQSVDPKLQTFRFSFRVRERTFSCRMHPLEITGAHPNRVTVKGTLVFSDPISADEVKQMIQVQGKGANTFPIEVQATSKANPTATSFDFRLANLPRAKEDTPIQLTFNGKVVDREPVIEEKVMLPGTGSFRLLKAQRIQEPENGIELVFSDPLSLTQDLKGLVTLTEASQTNSAVNPAILQAMGQATVQAVTQVEDNRLCLFFEEPAAKTLKLTVDESLRNQAGTTLARTQILSFGEQNLKPQVRMLSEAAILPDSKNLIIPFQAVNLHAVDLSVIRIYESNLLSFLQSNTLSSDQELRRFGRLIYKKTLWLNPDGSKDIHQWNHFSIDLAQLIQQEPGAIYRVVLSMQPDYSAYPCGESHKANHLHASPQNDTDKLSSEGLIRTDADRLSDEEVARWDEPNAYYYYNGQPAVDWSLYQWDKREDPCHPTYFMTNRSASCNVLASNLGVTVKQNGQHHLWISVNNLLTTEPLEKARITVYNYQLQPIGEGITDGNGWAQLQPSGVPFLVVAQHDQQKSYVRVVDGEELSVSRFDVSGEQVQKGLKGFLYGERGVWRPGDTLHLTFLLEDPQHRIPARHPVALEIYNPKGQFFTKQLSTHGLNGFYTFPVAIPADAPTGLWNAYVKVGGSTFHRGLRIETIQPNRLKLQLDLPRAFLSPAEKKRPLRLSASWLTGAQAAHLKAQVEVTLTKVATQFPNFPTYTFNHPASDFTTVKSEIFSGQLDAQGEARFEWKLPAAQQAPGLLNATFTSRVFEPGGRSSFYLQSVPYAPFDAYVGIDFHRSGAQTADSETQSFETDRDHWFDVVTVDSHGRLVARPNLTYKIYRIDWNWWWENSRESLGHYIQNTSILPVATGKLQTVNGKSRLKFRINYPDWGRYLVFVKDEDSGHATGGVVFADWPEWRGRAQQEHPNGIQMLTFTLDRKKYEVGETVTATLPASAGGRALVSLENGSTVLQQQWIEVAPQKDTKFSFVATSEMAPNVYLHITLLQPHAQTVNDLPIRMYGIMPVFIHNPETVLQPEIRLPAVLKPEQKFRVTVGEKQGKAMTYTLALVDEGLLDLTRFQTPNPWQAFYAREALGIRTWDLYDDVLGAFAGRYGQLFSTGGDASLKPVEEKANRFQPVVLFRGPFHLKAGQHQHHTLELPPYIGSVRVMVVAGQDGAYGSAQQNARVRSPLMLLSTLPRTLSLDEEVEVPVHLFSMESAHSPATVSLHVLQGDLQGVGPQQQTVSFDRNGEGLTFFRLRTGRRPGKAVIRISAAASGHRAHEQLEIDLRNPHPAVTLTTGRWVEKGQTVTLSAPSDATFEVTRIPTVNLTQRFDFLQHYPHLCTEQLVSKGLPLLFVESFRSLDKAEQASLKAEIDRCIQQLYNRQLANGGFSYWPGQAVAHEWVTSYAGFFLTLAQEKGYAVSPQVWNRWKRFQQQTAQQATFGANLTRWQRSEAELQQAFRLYTLALANVPEYGAMNRMKEQSSLTTPARWRLATAYALLEKPQVANELIFGTKPVTPSYEEPSVLFGSSLRDQALYLETLIRLQRDSEAREVARQLVQLLNEESRFSTQSTACSLWALALYSDQLSGSLAFDWQYNGQPQPAVKSARTVFLRRLPSSPKQPSITLTNRGEAGIQASLLCRIQPLQDTLPALNQGLHLSVQYQDLQGQPLSVDRLPQGTDFQVCITVSHPSGTKAREHLALTYLLPSGWELYNERLLSEVASSTAAPFNAGSLQTDYVDYRDDRVATYFRLQPGEQKCFTFRLQAAYLGRFTLPAVQCEAMYDPQVVARTRAGRTEVVRAVPKK